MIFSEPSRLGIIACPGGEKFADEIIGFLKQIYVKEFDRKIGVLSRRYHLTREESITKLNFSNDVRSSQRSLPGPVDSYRPPSFRVPATFTRFANGEFKTEIQSTVRGVHLYIVQDVENHYPISFQGDPAVLSVNDHIMSLMVTIDAALHAGAKTVSVIIPAYPYSRQHKKKGREGLTAGMLGHMLEVLGVSRIITLDIHSREIENSFAHVHLENLHASYQIIKKLSEIISLKDEDLVVVSPDTGAVDRNKYYAGSLRKPLALLYKERDYSKVTKDAKDSNITSIRLLGSVEGKTVFMADDLLGTGGTLIKAMKLLTELGATKIICAVSLPLFTGNAVEQFEEAYRAGYFYRLIGTNAVFHEDRLLGREWYVSANVSYLFARTISRLHHNLSLSPLLDNNRVIQKLLGSPKDTQPGLF